MPHAAHFGVLPGLGGTATSYRAHPGAQRRALALPVAYLLLPGIATTWDTHQSRDPSHHLWRSGASMAGSRRRAQVQRVTETELLGREHQRPPGVVSVFPRLQVKRSATRMADEGGGKEGGKGLADWTLSSPPGSPTAWLGWDRHVGACHMMMRKITKGRTTGLSSLLSGKHPSFISQMSDAHGLITICMQISAYAFICIHPTLFRFIPISHHSIHCFQAIHQAWIPDSRTVPHLFCCIKVYLRLSCYSSLTSSVATQKYTHPSFLGLLSYLTYYFPP